MSQVRKNTSTGENTGDDVVPPVSDGSWLSEEPADVVDRSSQKIRFFILSCAAILIAMAALQWADVVEWVEGEWRLSPKREAERDKQMRKIDDAEQYALVANIPGYYECLHCPFKRIFLKYNEVWKYGVTNQGEKQRYTTQFLEQRGLRYVMQFSGTYSQCLVEEKRKLFEYPLLPENLARPDSIKLVLPPGNLQMR